MYLQYCNLFNKQMYGLTGKGQELALHVNSEFVSCKRKNIKISSIDFAAADKTILHFISVLSLRNFASLPSLSTPKMMHRITRSFVSQSTVASFSSSTSKAFLACLSSSFIASSSVQRFNFGKSWITNKKGNLREPIKCTCIMAQSWCLREFRMNNYFTSGYSSKMFMVDKTECSTKSTPAAFNKKNQFLLKHCLHSLYTGRGGGVLSLEKPTQPALPLRGSTALVGGCQKPGT